MKILSQENLIKEFKEDYYMYIPLSIIVSSCVGSIAAMTILAQGTSLIAGLELTLAVALCMGYNAALLAGINAKFTFRLLVLSLVVNTLLIILTGFIL